MASAPAGLEELTRGAAHSELPLRARKLQVKLSAKWRQPRDRLGGWPQGGGGLGDFGNEPLAHRALTGIGGALAGIVWGAIIFAGAGSMRSLRNNGFAMAACIVGMLPCNGCCLLGLPFGIWGLTVINRQDVRPFFD